MRKLITTAITTAALITIAGGTAAYAVLVQSNCAAPTTSIHQLSVHASHDGEYADHHAEACREHHPLSCSVDTTEQDVKSRPA